MTAARLLSLQTLSLEQAGRVLTARYSSPPLNFVTTAFIRDLYQLTKVVDDDVSVGAVVLTGGIEGRFLTHADPQEIAGIQKLPHPELPMWLMRPVVPLLNLVLRLPGLAVRSSGSVAIPARGSSGDTAGNEPSSA